MEEKVFKTYIGGIYCIRCPELIIAALLQKRGVIDANVEYFKSLVKVKFDPEIVSENELSELLNAAGYPPVERKPSLAQKLLSRAKHAFDR